MSTASKTTTAKPKKAVPARKLRLLFLLNQQLQLNQQLRHRHN